MTRPPSRDAVCVVRDCARAGKPDMIWLGLRNELWGILICFAVGLLFGVFAAALFYAPQGSDTLESIAETFTGKKYLYSSEVYNRGTPWALFVGPCAIQTCCSPRLSRCSRDAVSLTAHRNAHNASNRL